MSHHDSLLFLLTFQHQEVTVSTSSVPARVGQGSGPGPGPGHLTGPEAEDIHQQQRDYVDYYNIIIN